MHRGHLTRRDFFKGTFAAGAGIALGGLVSQEAWGQAEEKKKSVVALVRDAAALDAEHNVNVGVLESMLTRAVTTATGEDDQIAAWRKLVKPSDVVGIVTTTALAPTHKELADIVVARVKAVGVPEDRIHFIQKKADLAEKCTAFINMPALKCHWLTGIGTVLKNYIMYSRNPTAYHEADSSNLGAIWNMPICKGKTRINIVDALRPLFDKGPQVDPRYLWDYKGIIVGTDPVAVETVCLQILQAKRNEYKGEPWPISPPPLCVKAADEQHKLGTSDPAKIDLRRIGWTEGVLV